MIHTALNTPCPTRRIALPLPLATIEALDQLAEREHVSRRQLLGQIVTAGLLNNTPHLPTGQDPIGRLAEHHYATHRRSLELAGLS